MEIWKIKGKEENPFFKPSFNVKFEYCGQGFYTYIFLVLKTRFKELTTFQGISNLVLWVDHSLGDDISLMSLFLACTRKATGSECLPIIPRKTLTRLLMVEEVATKTFDHDPLQYFSCNLVHYYGHFVFL